MSLPRFFHPQLPPDGDVALDDAEARHASNVLRLELGAEVILFDGCGGEARGTVAAMDKRSVVVSITARTDSNRELRRPLELLVALPKGDRQKTLVDGLVQLGVTRLIPLICQRGVAQPTASALERLQRGVVESSKQCGRNQLMAISAPYTISQAISQQYISESDGQFRLRCVAHPYGTRQTLSELALSELARSELADCQAGQVAGGIMAVGPEGGFTDAEMQQWAQAGWPAVDLGPRILRVEMAALQLAAWWSSL